MHTYECDKCGMSVNATCGKCDTPLVNDHLVLDDGSSVQISKCPSCLGKLNLLNAVERIWFAKFKALVQDPHLLH